MSQKAARTTNNNVFQIVVITATVSVIVGFLVGVGFSSLQSGKAKTPKDHPSPGFVPKKNAVQNQAAAHISVLESEVVTNPDNESAWTQLGNLYFDNNQVAKAIHAYSKSLALKPDNANVLTDLGIMYRRNNEFQKALETFKRANANAPRHEVSLLNYGIVMLFDLRDTAGAVEAWEKLIKINKNAQTSDGRLLIDVVEEIKK